MHFICIHVYVSICIKICAYICIELRTYIENSSTSTEICTYTKKKSSKKAAVATIMY